MSETRVVHVNDKIAGAVYIGRAVGRKGLKASPFANPWSLQMFGMDREMVIGLYSIDLLNGSPRSWDWEPKPLKATLSDLPELRGKPLACWCRHDGEPKTPENACHGDILVELLDRYTDDELRAMAHG